MVAQALERGAPALIAAVAVLAGCGGDDSRPGERVGRDLVRSVRASGDGTLTGVACKRDERMTGLWRCTGDYAGHRGMRFRVRTAPDGRILVFTPDERAEFGKTAWPVPGDRDTITVESPAFMFGSTVPARFTCDGENTSPPLQWKHIPRKARSLALVVEDRYLPGFSHWVVVGVPVTASSVDAGQLPEGAAELLNGFGETSYRGPCPAKGDLGRAFSFTVLALSKQPSIQPGASPDQARRAILRVAIARGFLGAGYP
jgi:Raf kinase inhibitor-like YbhB/YbcL family protein